VGPDKELFVVGAGWFAVEVAGWAEDSGWRVAGLVELVDPARVGMAHAGYAVVEAAALPRDAMAVVAGARDHDRRDAWDLAESRGCRAATIVHPTAHVAGSASIAPGAIVGPAAVIGAGTAAGEHALLSRGTLVGHHVTIGPFTRLLPGANVASHVELGPDVTVGMSAAVVDHLSVGESAVVAAGAVVLRDVPPRTRVQGVPAHVFSA
jgi:sugar O-acyltransferase (sialic acid O-acetyltransferase NeuD family)